MKKKYRLRYLPLANLDLIGIDEALAQSPVKASKFFSALDKQTSQLIDTPMMFPVYDDVPVYRKMVVLEYLLFYIVNKENETIDIHRIIHGRMDISAHLNAD